MTIKHSLSFILGFVLIVLSGMLFAAGNTIVISPAKSQFTIKLDSNRTTGYSWSVKQYDKKLLTLVNHNYIAPNTKLIGAPGYELWTFKAKPTFFKGAGMTKISLVYARPWESNVNNKPVVYIIRAATVKDVKKHTPL